MALVALVFQHEAAVLGGALQHGGQLRRRHRLLHEIVGALLQRGHRVLQRGLAGDDDADDGFVDAPQLLEQVEPVLVLEMEIDQRHVDHAALPLGDGQRLRHRLRDQHDEPFAGQHPLEQNAQGLVVVHHQHDALGIHRPGGGVRREAFGRGLAQRGHFVRKAQLVAPRLLGPVERPVGLDEEGLRAVAGSGQHGAGADGNGDAQIIGVRADDRAAEQLQHPLGDPARFGFVRPRQDQHQFVAAVIAVHDVGVPHAGPRQRGAFLQHLVADHVAIGIVHRLEMVDVDDEQADGERLVLALLPNPVQFLVEGAAIQQARQRIPDRHLEELLARQQFVPAGFVRLAFALFAVYVRHAGLAFSCPENCANRLQSASSIRRFPPVFPGTGIAPLYTPPRSPL